MTDRDARTATDDVDLLSALTDGESTGAEAARTCQRWHHDEQLRSDWHTYHLIGDVLRSDDLARHGSDDERFLQRLRERLAQEPAVLAPRRTEPADAAEPASAASSRIVPLPVRRSPMRRWGAPVGVAAGVVLVASAFMVSRPDLGTGTAGPQFAKLQSPGDTGVVPTQLSTPAPAAPQGLAALPDQRARAAQFSPYFSAHQQFQNANAIGPGSVYTRATFEAGDPR